MGHAPKVATQEENNWDLEQAIRETGKEFFNRFTTVDDRNNQPNSIEDFGLSGATTT